jgi:glycerophosphoryl diester phosphodiesterase
MTLIYAHRGASATHPENTLLAFRAALESGADGIELDVHLTADGIPVVIHDRDVARTTDGYGLVDEMPLKRLQALDAGRGERVPTLAEVVSLISDAVHLDIEIKAPASWPHALDVLGQFPSARYAISSFAWETLRDIRRRDARVELWPLAERASDDLLAIAAALGAPLVALAAAAYTPESAARLRESGRGAMIWTVNDGAEAKRVRDLGARALCTDDPHRVRAALLGTSS